MKILQISAGPNPNSDTSNSYLDSIGFGLSDLGHEITALYMAIPGRETFFFVKILTNDKVIHSGC